MATFTITGGGNTGVSANAVDVKLLSVVVDFSSTTNSANDVFECIELAANTYVVTAGIEVMTADTAGNSGTVSLGDGDDVDRYVTAQTIANTNLVPIRAQAGAGSQGTTSIGYGNYTAADTIDVVVATGAINAVIRVWAIVADYDGLGGNEAQKVTFA
tara:strand:+ start:1257 stop:1730 length:474 start_codon:yes stop_codon:yes gene_type:complete